MSVVLKVDYLKYCLVYIRFTAVTFSKCHTEALNIYIKTSTMISYEELTGMGNWELISSTCMEVKA